MLSFKKRQFAGCSDCDNALNFAYNFFKGFCQIYDIAHLTRVVSRAGFGPEVDKNFGPET